MNDPSAASRGQPSAGVTLALMLVAADLGFIALHVLTIQRTRWARYELLLTEDGTIPEHYQYVKLAWVVLLLIMLGLYRRRWAFVPWAALFLYVVVDDFFAAHEQVGRWVDGTTSSSSVAGIPTAALGELVLPALVAAALSPFLLWSLVTGPPADRAVLRRTGVLTLVFAFFGVVVDLMHAAAPDAGEAWKVWGVVEEGGELFVASAIVALLFAALTTAATLAPEKAPPVRRDGGGEQVGVAGVQSNH